MKLTDQQIDIIIDDTLSSISIDDTLKKIGFTRKDWNKYLKANPEIKKLWEEAMVDACPFIENDLLNLHNKFVMGKEKKKADRQLAQVWSNNAMRILESRKPDKYGRKIDMNLNQNVSIKDNIEKAAGRLQQALRDVGPALLSQIKKIETDGK